MDLIRVVIDSDKRVEEMTSEERLEKVRYGLNEVSLFFPENVNS